MYLWWISSPCHHVYFKQKDSFCWPRSKTFWFRYVRKPLLCPNFGSQKPNPQSQTQTPSPPKTCSLLYILFFRGSSSRFCPENWEIFWVKSAIFLEIFSSGFVITLSEKMFFPKISWWILLPSSTLPVSIWLFTWSKILFRPLLSVDKLPKKFFFFLMKRILDIRRTIFLKTTFLKMSHLFFGNLNFFYKEIWFSVQKTRWSQKIFQARQRVFFPKEKFQWSESPYNEFKASSLKNLGMNWTFASKNVVSEGSKSKDGYAQLRKSNKYSLCDSK